MNRYKPIAASAMNQRIMIGPKATPIFAVPFFCTMNNPKMIATEM